MAPRREPQAPAGWDVVDHQAEGLDDPPLIALRQTSDALDAARRRVRHLEEERRSQVERALSYGIPAAKVARAARISRARLYAAFRDEISGTSTTRRGGPPAPDAGTAGVAGG